MSWWLYRPLTRWLLEWNMWLTPTHLWWTSNECSLWNTIQSETSVTNEWLVFVSVWNVDTFLKRMHTQTLWIYQIKYIDVCFCFLQKFRTTKVCRKVPINESKIFTLQLNYTSLLIGLERAIVNTWHERRKMCGFIFIFCIRKLKEHNL